MRTRFFRAAAWLCLLLSRVVPALAAPGPISYYPGGPLGSLPGRALGQHCVHVRAGGEGRHRAAPTGQGGLFHKAGSFIGVTDAPASVYRILSIDAQHMVLRAGSSTGSLVFTMQLVAK